MAVYDIAGLTVSMTPHGRTAAQAEKYLSPDQSKAPDLEINITPALLRQARAYYPPEVDEDGIEYLLSGTAFYTKLLEHGGMLLHASCVVVDGYAYLFTAHSGTGKSTHTGLWLQKFGARAYILNDDKPALRRIDGQLCACGTPWSGKFDISRPENVPVAAIALLSRSKGRPNSIRRASVAESLPKLMAQTVNKLNENHMDQLLNNLEQLVKNIPIYDLSCDMSPEAADMAWQAMRRDADGGKA